MPRYKKKQPKQRFNVPEPLHKGTTAPLKALTKRQQDYINAINRHDQVVTLGCAGTGKSYIAATMAADAYARHDISKIILTRPAVGVDEEHGFLPGDLGRKIAPWVVPFTEVMEERLGSERFNAAMKRGDIQVVPLAFMRGRTFRQAYVILDEAQNTTYSQIKMFLTRIGEDAKVLINGDITQSDLKRRQESGLSAILGIIQKQHLNVPVIEFNIADVVRSGTCKMWTEAFIKHEEVHE